MAEDEGRRLVTTDGARARLGRWRVEPLGADDDGRLRVRLARDDGASIELMVHPAGSEPRALASTEAGDVTYVAQRGVDAPEAVRLGRAFAQNLARAPQSVVARFPHVAPALALPSGDAPPAPREVLFDPPGLAALLEPAWVVDGAPHLGFTLRSVQLPRTTGGALGTYLLELADAEGRAVFVDVGRELPRPFGRAGELEIAIRRFGRGSSHEELIGLDVASLLSHLLARLGHALEGVTLRWPASLGDLRALSVPAEGDAGVEVAPGVLGRAVLNLAVDAECEQACVFCSVKDYQPPTDGGDAELARLELELAAARRDGAREVRLNGIDPLAFSRVLPLVAAIRAQGFEKLRVFTTAKRFADAGFAARFVERAPEALSVVVPLYGVTAASHDAVTGLPGSFETVSRAIEVLHGTLTRPAELILSTVVVRQNVDELPALLARADALEVAIYTHLPYPMSQSARDPWTSSALRESELLARVLDADASERVRKELAHLIGHPCVLLAEEQARGLPLFGLREAHAPTHLHGTEYRAESFVHVGSDPTERSAFSVATAPCPHASECALAPTCAREQYALYVQQHGWDEVRPVTPRALYELAPK
ncbi:MAG: hypothetical protein H6719_24865 [Sandaracinaceae bacterium]|nr:hypothetical protein [Sandaracinaceae bacterium]